MRRVVPLLPLPFALAIYVACGGSTASGPGSFPQAEAGQVQQPDASPDVVTCDPPRRFCNTVCVDPESDPNNCGKCGNACSLGTCSAGACTNAAIFAFTK